MNNVINSLTIVFPLLFYMLVGVGVRKTQVLDKSAMLQINSLIFKLFLPLSIFNNISASESGDISLGPVLIYATFFLVLVFFASWFLFARIEKKRERRGVMIQNAFSSNFALFGMSLSMLILDGKGTGLTETLIAITLPIINIMVVIILQFYGTVKTNSRQIARGIMSNPLIIAAVLGVLFRLSGLVIPAWFNQPLLAMGRIASPLALIVLGGQFNFHRSSKYVRELILGVSLRLIIVPVLALLGAIMLGFRGEVLVAYLALFASPVAVSSHLLAQQMGGDHELAAQLLVYTSVFCIFTLLIFIFILKQFTFI